MEEWKQRLQVQQQRHNTSKENLNQRQKSLSTVQAGVEHLAGRLHHIKLVHTTLTISTVPALRQWHFVICQFLSLLSFTAKSVCSQSTWLHFTVPERRWKARAISRLRGVCAWTADWVWAKAAAAAGGASGARSGCCHEGDGGGEGTFTEIWTNCPSKSLPAALFSGLSGCSMQFYVKVEEKLPAYNTRIRLLELRARDGESTERHMGPHGDACLSIHHLLSPRQAPGKGGEWGHYPGGAEAPVTAHRGVKVQEEALEEWKVLIPLKETGWSLKALSDLSRNSLISLSAYQFCTVSGFKWVGDWKYKCECLVLESICSWIF